MTEPVIDIAIEPRSPADQVRLVQVLAEIAASDPGMRWKTDTESGQTIISGASELHLDEIAARVRTAVAANVGAPQVAYRETIGRAVNFEYAHRTLGSSIRIKFRIVPLNRRGGFAFMTQAANLTAQHVEGVRAGIDEVRKAGPIIGFLVIDFGFTLIDCVWHQGDPSVESLAAAARAGLRGAIEEALPAILEPIMAVIVTVPEDYVGDAIGDLNRRRGMIIGVAGDEADQVVQAMVPLANLFGYVNDLRALTRATGRYTMVFDHYERVPDAVGGPNDRFRPAMAMRA